MLYSSLSIAKKSCTARRVSTLAALRELCHQKGIEWLEGHARPEHIHLCLSIPPKYSFAYTIGFLKGKSVMKIHREVLHHKRMTGLHFWARGYGVSTVGLDEAVIRQYLREQEQSDKEQAEFHFE